MQIFVTDPCPKRSAQRLWKNPTRARNMIRETSQLLAYACYNMGINLDLKTSEGYPYKMPQSRLNNKITLWVSENKTHLSWVIDHLYELYSHYVANGGGSFLHINDNLIKLYQVHVSYDVHKIKFLNFAKADSKKLNYTSDPSVFRAYDLFLKAQGA
jgi:hypothetical protein